MYLEGQEGMAIMFLNSTLHTSQGCKLGHHGGCEWRGKECIWSQPVVHAAQGRINDHNGTLDAWQAGEEYTAQNGQKSRAKSF